MAPDQLIGKPADQSCDVFSFGVLVWECITRKLPLKHIKSLAKFAKKTVDPRLHKIPANCSQNFKALITDCLKTALERPNFQQVQEINISRSAFPLNETTDCSDGTTTQWVSWWEGGNEINLDGVLVSRFQQNDRLITGSFAL